MGYEATYNEIALFIVFGYRAMSFELYLAFVVATTVLVIIPGPNVTLIVANSLAHGTRHGLVTVSGTAASQAVQLAITCIGMTSLMLVLSQWFEWLRWVGVAYLIYLGIREWRAGGGAARAAAVGTVSAKALFWQGFLVSATNPKTLLFYAAFFPQFIEPQGPLAFQMIVLSATFLVIATVLDGSYAMLAGRVSGWLANDRRARLRARLTGSLLIGAGLGLALVRRS